MSKTQRLIELMMTVNAKRKFKARELAEEFGVSYRTILRDLDELSALGVPLYSEVGADGGYFVLNERMLPPVVLKESEAVALYFAFQSLQFIGSLPFETETSYVLKKLYQYLPQEAKKRIDSMKDRVVFWHPSRVQSANYLELIVHAAVDQSALKIEYDSQSGVGERVIQPIGLYSHNGFWYCPAYCFLRQEVRLFRADRIKKAAGTDEEKQSLPYSSIMDWLLYSEACSTGPIHFLVELTKEGVRRAMSEVDLDRHVERREDGTGFLQLEIPRSELTYFVDLIWNFGSGAKIIEPQEAIIYMKDKIKKMDVLYH
ncbi:helix-turn-helix transcriptional regulator [Alkalihalobacillus pseudalcaliphilus]|uniref:helix-turn-helix transcriptional regulator n=1 Tax=Alkalihalobacillus pseudalcaliphilus TaxID=79884 RepID=UPI00064E009F|nr:YafY family protein [Alkalihalobacillus pseudalcaliphilus]KMK76803.1 transcriptional regulator [Alkalihalobacillus pseudalcaliphilus]